MFSRMYSAIKIDRTNLQKTMNASVLKNPFWLQLHPFWQLHRFLIAELCHVIFKQRKK
jgi:hypothetical protein